MKRPSSSSPSPSPSDSPGSADEARRASDARFQQRREELVEALRSLLGTHAAAAPLPDADRAAALAAEARASHRTAGEHEWGVARREWTRDDRGAVVALLHIVRAHLGPRPVWLIVPGREPQAVVADSDAVLDNPLGFAALADFELVLLDQQLPAGLWLLRHSHGHPDATTHGWELEVWGEPWLSATTRAMRELRASD
jgi:hypothetical protein